MRLGYISPRHKVSKLHKKNFNHELICLQASAKFCIPLEQNEDVKEM